MNELSKPYPLTKCTPEEAARNHHDGIMRAAADETLRVAILTHGIIVSRIISQSEAAWDGLKKKYGLDAGKNYGIRFIDGAPYICEIKLPE